jgi:hypothetical protein
MSGPGYRREAISRQRGQLSCSGSRGKDWSHHLGHDSHLMPHAVVNVPISLAWILDVGTMTTSRISSSRRLDSATTNHLFTQSPTVLLSWRSFPRRAREDTTGRLAIAVPDPSWPVEL